MPVTIYPSVAKIKRNGVYENLPGFEPETGSVATQQMIATAEVINVAQYVHNKGEYFRLNDTLYQAIVKINIGDSIVVGTNCEVAVIGNDLTHVANSIANYELGIATSSHNTGDYFMVNETMYVATADIQVGDSISTSTNCRKAVVGDELSELKTAITAQSEQIDTLGGNVTAETLRAITAENLKINKPIASPNGTNGQLLSTNGDGTTTWTDFGLPTDAQTATAINAWLDAHPEATTTVVDNSLTYAKLVKGTLGFVTPEMFGAVGDGLTDDTTAIKDCIEYAMQYGFKAVFCKGKTYIIDRITINMKLGQDIYIDGSFATLKRKDNSVPQDTDSYRMLVLTPHSSYSTEGTINVCVCNLNFDGNNRNQIEPSVGANPYVQEHCTCFLIQGKSYLGIKNFYFYNCTFYDPMADGLTINDSSNGESFVENAFISNISCSYRTRTRSDICLTGRVQNAFYSDINVTSIEMEPNANVDNPSYSFISNLQTGVFDWTWHNHYTIADNIRATEYFAFTSSGKVSNSVFTNGHRTSGGQSNVGNIYRNKNTVFENCKFIIPVYESDGSYELTSLELNKLNEYVEFSNCVFDIYNPDNEDYGQTYVIKTSGTQTGISAPKCEYVFNNCKFPECGYLFYDDRNCRKISFKNSKLYGGLYFTGGTSDYPLTVYLEDVIHDGRITHGFNENSKGFVFNNYVLVANSTNGLGMYRRSSSDNVFTINGNRIVKIDFELTASAFNTNIGSSAFQILEGDTFIYDGASANEISKWKNLTRQTSKVGVFGQTLKTGFETPYGTTANRPNTFMSKGQGYFDEDLAKMIFWNSSAWVNADGTALA